MINKLFHSEIPSTVSDRYLAGAAGLLLIGSIAAFFMYIPVLPIIGTVIVLMALMLMFALGLYCGISLEQKVTWRRHQFKTRVGRSARDLDRPLTTLSDQMDSRYIFRAPHTAQRNNYSENSSWRYLDLRYLTESILEPRDRSGLVRRLHHSEALVTGWFVPAGLPVAHTEGD
jgi:hypothetical protein